MSKKLEKEKKRNILFYKKTMFYLFLISYLAQLGFISKLKKDLKNNILKNIFFCFIYYTCYKRSINSIGFNGKINSVFYELYGINFLVVLFQVVGNNIFYVYFLFLFLCISRLKDLLTRIGKYSSLMGRWYK